MPARAKVKLIMAPIKVCFLLLTLAAGNDVDSCAASPEGCLASSDTDPNTLLQSRVSAHVAGSIDALDESLVDSSKKTCKEYTCPSGYKAKDTPLVGGGCDDEDSCNFNCCDFDVNGHPKQRNKLLYMATLIALQNVTAVANDIDNPRLHDASDHDNDVALVQDSAAGLFFLMRQILLDKADKFCPLDDYTSIRLCLSSAICVIEKNLQAELEYTQAYTLMQEYMVKFETVTWPQLVDVLEQVDPKDVALKKVGYRDPDELSCRGYDLLTPPGPSDAGPDLGLTASGSSSDSSARADAYHTSTALINAAKTTHRILDAHTSNTSLDVTIKALHGAWEHPCKLLNCDHTNYWDFVGASYSHSVALLESGASAEHMRTHVQTRARLDHRVQHFMGHDGVSQAHRVFTSEGTHTDARATRYGSVVIGGLRHVLTSLPESYEIYGHLFSLVDRQKLKTFFDEPGQPSVVDAVLNNQVVMARRDQTPDQRNSDEHSDEMSEGDRAHKRHQEQRVLLIQNRWGVILCAAFGGCDRVDAAEKATGVDIREGVAKEAEKVIRSWGEFLEGLLHCLGVGSMSFVGYGLRICAIPGVGAAVTDPPCTPLWAAGVAVTVSISTNGKSALTGLLTYLMGKVPQTLPGGGDPEFRVTVGISICAGLIPGGGGAKTIGGFRSGLGIALGLELEPMAGSIKLKLGLAAVAIGVIPKSGTPQNCPWPSFSIFGLGFKCLAGTGVVAKLLCCDVTFKPGPVQVSCTGDAGKGATVSTDKANEIMKGGLGKAALNLVKADVECKSGDSSMGNKASVLDCAEAVEAAGGQFFIYGKGSKAKACWKENTASAKCTEGWQSDSYDFYELKANFQLQWNGACNGNYIASGSGIQDDLSACKAKCDSVATCSFLSFCPSGTSACTGGNANKCALYSACSSSTGSKHRGYTTYRKATTLTDLGGSGCTSSSKCGQCNGDCDRDSDCASGFKCFQRSTSAQLVPGCAAGGSGDVPTHDYCFKEQAR